MRYLMRALCAALFLMAGCGETNNPGDPARILAIGDSLLASHSSDGASVSDRLEARLGEQVIDRSVSGARIVNPLPVSGALGMRISEQYPGGNWDWVILNGGGNDLWLGCGCGDCQRRMDRMIAADGSRGDIAQLVDRIRASGAQVIYLGYLRSPGTGSPIEHCRDDGDELEARLARMAAARDGVHFLSLADLVPTGDRSYHAADMIHPSQKASDAIGARIAEVIRDAENPR